MKKIMLLLLLSSVSIYCQKKTNKHTYLSTNTLNDKGSSKLSLKKVIEICKTSPNIKYNFNYETDITYNKKDNSYEIWCYRISSANKDDPGSTRTIGRYLLLLKPLKLYDVTFDKEELFLDQEKAKNIIGK
jgi:hypothetical protein